MEPIIYPVGNYAKLLSLRTDRFKSELLKVQFAFPITQKASQQRALLFELLRRGTERYRTKAHFLRQLDDLYASSIAPFSRKAGDVQLVGYTADFLGERFVGAENSLLPRIVEMLEELLLHPFLPEGCFNAPFVESEKRYFRDAIRARINHPRSYARSKCRALLCEGEPYALSLIGEEDTLELITPQGMTELWQELLKTATPTFFYVGNSDPAQVAALLEKSFGHLGGASAALTTIIKPPCSQSRCTQEEMPVSQGQLVLGYRTDVSLTHPLAAATSVLNEIFGGSPASKLFLNVREARSLCYHCSSSLDLYKGVMFAAAGIKPQNRDIAQSAMREQWEAILRGRISDTEWNAAKRALDHSYRQLSDLPGSLASFYMRRLTVGDFSTPEQRRQAIAAVTRDEVIEAAAHFGENAVFFLKGTQEEVEE